MGRCWGWDLNPCLTVSLVFELSTSSPLLLTVFLSLCPQVGEVARGEQSGVSAAMSPVYLCRRGLRIPARRSGLR